ncbi:MAG: hypothetical protein HKN33_02295 [Pyrinomonadaceae bacterium]|nr:hypothetical protein [Pyrinomonadaceae bacterium]
MNKYLKKLDLIAGIETKAGFPKSLERTSFVFLFIMLLAAPHSIAATQIAGSLGLVFWIIRHLFRPHPETKPTVLAFPLIALFGWTAITAFLSYAPDISVPKIRGESLFLIFFFAFNHLRNRRAARLAAGALIISCMVNVLWMPLERVIGKGVKIDEIQQNGPLFKSGFRDGDGLFQANGKEISTPSDIVTEIEKSGKASVLYYREGHYWAFEIARVDFLPGKSASEKLGIVGWSISRSWRSAGFYGHYTTYAEVLQLIGSLIFGLLIAGIGVYISKGRRIPEEGKSIGLENRPYKKLASLQNILLLAVILGLLSLALLLTITRAAQAGFLASLIVIVLMMGSRKLFITLVLILVPVIVGGTVFLQQTRGVGFFDLKDNSTSWRLRVYHEGISIATSRPRNFIFGVGVDSIKRYAKDWKLYENGIVLGGHFHSTPVQLLVERGFPGLLLWLWLFAAYLATLFKSLRSGSYITWLDRGILLGSFGGVIGFLVSSIVHYNFGDAEVVMVLYMVMAIGMSLALVRPSEKLPASGVRPG